MLRRNINKLLDPTYAQELKARLEYMRTILVPICYRCVCVCVCVWFSANEVGEEGERVC